MQFMVIYDHLYLQQYYEDIVDMNTTILALYKMFYAPYTIWYCGLSCCAVEVKYSFQFVSDFGIKKCNK